MLAVTPKTQLRMWVLFALVFLIGAVVGLWPLLVLLFQVWRRASG